MEHEKHIQVTHFINPQLFWYHKKDVPSDEYHEIAQLEERLLLLYKNKTISRFCPSIGDKVAVDYLPWNKIIRAQVQNIHQHKQNNYEYIMWALDYGFPFQTYMEAIHRLPEAFSKHIDHVRCGGLADLVAAQKEYNYMEDRPMMMVQEQWHQSACDLLEKQLKNASATSFVEKFCTAGRVVGSRCQYWGDLKIVNGQGGKFQAGNYLIGLNYAMEAKLNFCDNCISLKVTKISPWLSNSGRNKFKSNKYMEKAAIESRKCGVAVDEFGDNPEIDAKRKVEDWCARNERDGAGALEPFESPMASSFISIDEDISYDDSVSMASTPQVWQGHVNPAGALRKTKLKYRHSHIPPMPAMRAFQMNQFAPTNKGTNENESFSQNLSEDAKLVLDQKCDFSPRHLRVSAAPQNISSPASSVFSVRQQKLFEIRKKTSQYPSTVGSDISATNYQHLLEESTVNSTDNEEHLLIKNMNAASLLDKFSDQNSQISTQSVRASELSARRRRKAAASATVTSSTNTTTEEKSDVVAPTPSKYIQKIMKLKQNHMTKQLTEQTKEFEISSTTADTSINSNVMLAKSKLPEQIPFEFPDFTTESNTKKNEKNGIDAYNVLPAGFDFMNLYNYKDENHWHRKKTTLNDHIPHDKNVDTNDNNVDKSKNSSSSSDMWSARGGNDDYQPSLTVFNHNNQRPTTSGQNFRHTRSHTDKHKEDINDFSSECKQINADVYSPIDKKFTSNKEFSEPIDLQEIINDPAFNNDYKQDKTTSSFNSTNVLKHSKRRPLKSPAEQSLKMAQILRRANLEKILGNTEILDLQKVNLNVSRTDSDSNAELFSADSGSDFGNDITTSSSSNKRALLEKVLKKPKNEEQDKPGPLNVSMAGPQQLKLAKLEEHLNFELQLSSKTPTTTILQLPQALQLREIDSEVNMRTKFIDHLVLAHSKIPLQPLERLADAFFLQEIHDEMVNMRVTKVYRIQAYAWPHLLRGNSLCVINPSKSGKTWCYLPAICSLVSYRIQSGTLQDTYGPVAIIIVPSSAHVELVSNYCRRLLVSSKIKISTVPSFGVRNANEAKIQLLNSCGILVVTPSNLLRLLRDNEHESLIDPNRLQHLVIDDMDLMLSRSQKDFESVLKLVFGMSNKSTPGKIALQLVVTSRDWDSLMAAILRWSNQPLLLIGDFLEAAVYGKTEISIKLRSSDQKIGTILRFIEQHPLDVERLLILCNCDEDVDEVVNTLTASGYACIGYDGRSEAVVRTTIDEWKQKTLCSQILVCTDAAFPELQIQNVQCLIHYSMPTSWTKFTSRFSALAQTYENYVVSDFRCANNANVAIAYSLILLDEQNSIQLPRLIDFMKKHNQIKLIHSDILAVSKRVLVEREEARIFKGTPMCPYFMEFAECDEPRCDYRHNLTRFDVIAKTDDIPQAGDMRILILKVFSPTYYTARLLQIKPPNSSKWHILRRSDEAALFSMQLNLHYHNPDNVILHWPLHINDLCIYKISDTYQRARILELPQLKHTDIVQKVKVAVKLIDVGTIMSCVKSDELFQCADKFKSFPAQAIDIRLMGIIPFDNERTWDTKATKAVQQWIMNDISSNDCVHVSVNFAVANTIWVNNVIVMEQLPTVGQYIYRINLKRSLVEKNFGLINTMQGQSVRDIAEENDLLSTTPHDYESKIDIESLHNESINLIKFSSSEQTFSSTALEVDALETDTADNVELNKATTNPYPMEPNTDLLNDFNNENWDLLNEIKKDEIYLPLSKNKNFDERNANFINITAPPKINSCLYSTDEWCKLPLQQIIKVEIGDENENGNWTDIYLQCIDDAHLEVFEGLSNLILDHVEMLQQQPTDNDFMQSQLEPTQNCIVKYDNRYLRAKIHAIFGGEMEETIYRFFLCDYACFVTRRVDELFNDFLYATTKEIVAFTPYQAVHCTLAGIELDCFAKRHPVTKDYLFAYAVEERDMAPNVIKDLNIRSFDILLYECDTEIGFQSSKDMLNKVLVENGAATLKPDSKHHLDIKVNFEAAENDDLQNGGIVNFEELFNVIQKSIELDEEMFYHDADNEHSEQSRKEIIETKAMCAVAYKMHKDQQISSQNHKKPLTPINSDDKSVALYNRSTIQNMYKPNNHKATEEGDMPIKNKLKIFPPKSISKQVQIIESDEEELISSSISTTSNRSNSSSLTTSDSQVYTPAPPLLLLHARPQTTWYQTDCLIYLAIYAPDIVNYSLEVTFDTLLFAAEVQGKKTALVLNFLGTVEPQYVSHEIRGLNVVVRLVKSLHTTWPHLLNQTNKFPWLTYNLNAINTDEFEHLLPQQRLHFALEDTAGRHQAYDSDSGDSEHNLYQTFTPIVNSEDILDPMAELF